ncbi:MAG: DUF819 family protein [Deltaproteobacteria bacterium]|nr:DUF819 family protein [Deltaproteobacteria bacterium]
MLIILLQTLFSLAFPALALWGDRRSRVVAAISPVLLCYGVGMALGNQDLLPVDTAFATRQCEVLVALAIPLLLFSVDFAAWLHLAGGTVLSFGLVSLAAMVGAAAAWVAVGQTLPQGPALAGMLTGVYIGGTPNMAAIGTAFEVPPRAFVLLNAADMVASLSYLVFILALAPRLLARVLPPFRRRGGAGVEAMVLFRTLPRPRHAGAALLLSAAVVAVGAALGLLAPEGARSVATILAVTTLAVGLSVVPAIRTLPGTHDLGQYLLLVFCVAIGITTDFRALFASDPAVVLLAVVTVSVAVSLHLLLARVFRIDRDTAIVTSVAGIFGPHMIGPVAATLKNREILLPGILSGLVGFAVANYLGMGVTWLLQRLG